MRGSSRVVTVWVALAYSKPNSCGALFYTLRERGARALEERLSGKASAATKVAVPDVEAGAAA